MPDREINLYLQDIKEACKSILLYTNNISFEEYLKDKMRKDAVVRNLEIIGEAVKQLPKEKIEKFSSIEWKKIAGLRDILTHHYFGINDNIIWDVVKNKVPELRIVIEKMFNEINKLESWMLKINSNKLLINLFINLFYWYYNPIVLSFK